MIINKYNFDWFLFRKLFISTGLIIFLLFIITESWLLFLNLVITYFLILGLYFDSRIKWNRKILIFIIFCFLWIISIYIGKAPYLIIKDLFWYSVIMYGSFVFHVLILSWIYRICWLNRWEYSCYIISRISFILSLSFIAYIFQILAVYIYILNKQRFNSKLAIFNFIFYLIQVLLTILRYFIIIFHNYAIFIMGLNEKNEGEFIDNLLNIYKQFEFVLFTFFLSVIIGLPRLYIIWIFYFLKTSFDLYYDMYFYVKKYKGVKNFKDFLYNYYFKYELHMEPGGWMFQQIEKRIQYKKYAKIHEKPYYEFFVFDLGKFIFSDGWYDGCHDIPELKLSEFPIKTPFKFYSWIYMMQEYYKLSDVIYDNLDCSWPNNKYHWRTIEERFDDLMNMCKDINLDESQYNLITEELPQNLNIEIVKNQENFDLDEDTGKFILKKKMK